MAVLSTGHARRVGTFAGALLCVTALGADVLAAPLGHTASVSQIRDALGGAHTSVRCELVFPRELSKTARVRLADDCDFRVARAEAWLGVTHPERIRVFVFRSADEKAVLMGAAHTNIAKPWRAEVYLTHAPWPHPVLWHELVHVVAARIGRGPFRIAGGLGGVWPDAALIEGVAVAGAWQAQGGLTPHEWARALLDLEQLPSVRALFGLGFLGQPQRMAYTLSGSLLRFVAERHGSAAVRRAYTSGDLASATGRPLAQLETDWRGYLQTLPTSSRTRALAKARFSGKSIFSTVCPHALASLRVALRADLSAGDDMRALRTCREILDIDPADGETRASLVTLHARLGQDGDARTQLDALLAPDTAQPALAALARHAVADEYLRRGERTQAAALYEALLREPLDEDGMRTLQVKAMAAASDEAQARVLLDLLVGAPGERADPATAVHLARELRALRGDGLPHYLEGRQLLFQERFARAASLLTTALQLGLPTPELTREAQRTLALASFGSGDLAAAERWFGVMARDPALGRAAEGLDGLARIRFARKRQPAPPSLSTTKRSEPNSD
jgi:tetratricopeptide (TPR) repeat protein